VNETEADAVANQTTDLPGQMLQQAQATVRQTADEAREKAPSLAVAQKDKASQSLEQVAQALRQTGQQLGEQGQGPASRVSEIAAEQLDRMADYLNARDINEIISEAEAFARRQPGLFLGSAFTLGFMASRFLKSSPPREASDGTTD
jgi:DNA anti-recombination protein RmuC